MVLPEPGFHDGPAKPHQRCRHAAADRRDAHHFDRAGRLPRTHGLDPDLFVLGKPVAGGVPASVWGMSADVAQRYDAYSSTKEPGYSGIGTTLSGNPLQFAAMRATLEEVMTDANYAHMERLAPGSKPGFPPSSKTQPALACRAGRGAGGVHLRARSAEQRRRGRGSPLAAARSGDPCRPGQSRRADRALPQHDAGLAGHDRAAGRPAGRGIRRYCGKACRMRQGAGNRVIS